MGLWNMRAYAWSFGIYISLFTMIFSFFAILGSNGTVESEFVAMFCHPVHVPELPGRPEPVHGA
jgi:hypothetical protein